MKLLKVSPQGQITIPKTNRIAEQYILETNGNTLILRPVEIKPLDDDLLDFSGLANQSFQFWNDESEDIYQDFYN